MKATFFLLFLTVVCPAMAEPYLQPELEAFRPLLGKTFRGELAGSEGGAPRIDVSRWERALNGRVVRNLHSVNEGEYGGESIIYWDAEREMIRYHYYTTAGFRTEGSMVANPDGYTAHETVTGGEGGVTEVRSRAQLLPDGTLRTESQYLRNGEWVTGHSARYRTSDDAEVIFR